MFHKFYYLKQSVFFFLPSLFSLLLSSYFSYETFSVLLNLSLFSTPSVFSLFSLYLTPSSLIFSSVVTFITASVMGVSSSYMNPMGKNKYYVVLVYLFVGAMLVVVNCANLFYLMLGWDGLGLVSYFLIAFYNNTKSLHAASFSLIINRIGDSFFVAGIILCKGLMGSLSLFSNAYPWLLVSVMLSLAFITKTAIFPFSSWLPIAMSAPTPISALVHSSTLVTAGLYLFMRFSHTFLVHAPLMSFLMLTSLFTSLYAGGSALFEVDYKKLIALSTLSHLGFILLAFTAGLVELAFFHLVVHALFKSLLFLAYGGMMMGFDHSQDGRYIGSVAQYTPLSAVLMMVSIFSLVGMPSVSGFYSKDLVLESLSYSKVSGGVIFVLYFNVFLTYMYSYKLLLLNTKKNAGPFMGMSNYRVMPVVLLFSLGVYSVMLGAMKLSLNSLSTESLPVVSLVKMFPFVLNACLFVGLITALRLHPRLCKNIFNYSVAKLLFLGVLQKYLNQKALVSLDSAVSMCRALKPRSKGAVSLLLHIKHFPLQSGFVFGLLLMFIYM